MDEFMDYGRMDTRSPEEKAQARRQSLIYNATMFKDDDPDTMIRRLEALENFIVNGVNEVTS